MNATSVIALFCEDIREEKGGVLTLVGILPDVVNAAPPGNLAPDSKHLFKLCVYVRINFDPAQEFREGKMRLVMPDDTVHDIGAIDLNTMKQARENAKEKGLPLAGIISRAVLGNFQLPKPGLLKLEIVLDDQVYVGAAVRFQLLPSSVEASVTSSTSH